MNLTKDLSQIEIELELDENPIERARRYYYQGEITKARELHLENLKSEQFTTDERLRTILGLFSVEWTAGNTELAHDWILQAKEVAKTSMNEELLAAIHNNYGLFLRKLFETSGNADYADQAIIEYTASIVYYELSGNVKYQATAENNLAYLQLVLNRLEQALTHAQKSKALHEIEGDRAELSYACGTIAQIYLAMDKPHFALRVIKEVVDSRPQNVGDMSYWFDACSYYAEVLFKLEDFYEGKKALAEAIEIAGSLGQSNVVGRLTLLMLENCEQIFLPLEIVSLCLKVYPLISEEKDLARLATISNKFYSILKTPEKEEINFDEAVERLERETIRRALVNANGSITNAANEIGFSYQRLQSTLSNRLTDLSSERTPPHKRRKSIIKK